MVDGTLTEGHFDFFCVILLAATIHLAFLFYCFSSVEILFCRHVVKFRSI